ncbi:MAG TPA: hypothetical protein VL282_14520 [Tepidisphaeraceae bacterium]|jgi:hypothetical protein|nr:hypothetical protein [Tepidisphaeraceae bacterium]
MRMLPAFVFLAMYVHAAEPPIVITGPEQRQIDMTLPDGGLPWYPGVSNIQIFRASRVAPDLADGRGWTYHHHLDLGVWKGRMYCAWNSCEKDEDVWPSRELYATSEDGVHWSEPKELFPLGLSAAQRMYFFHAPNGRMLALAGGRDEKTHERIANAMVVREILADHTLGPVVHLLPDTKELAGDPAFVEACHQLLANKPFLEQADYGALLGERKMKWHDINTWPATEPSRAEFPRRFGKAMCFYHRKDGALVSVMKWGWVLVSRDEGETWSPPVRPPTLVAGMAKVWGQRTSDGRYALAYNPDLEKRWPLVVTTGDDGITFNNMRVIFGELPPMRYEGLYKVPGPQYVRGVSEWASDGSFKDDAMWIAYSVNKEDIWISRVPVGATLASPGLWNTYSSKWAPVTAQKETLTLEDRDPSDYARAVKLIEPSKHVEIAFDLTVEETNDSPLFVDLFGPHQSRVARVTIDPKTRVRGKALAMKITADCAMKAISATIDNQVIHLAPMADAKDIIAVSIQTGERAASIAAQDDHPIAPARYRVQHFSVANQKS